MVPLLMLLIANAGMVDCKAFGARSGLPIEAQIARISAHELDPSAKPIKNSMSSNNQSYQIGRLIYQGNGYSYRSFDDRFPLTALSFVGHTRSICQYKIVIPDGYDSATGTFIKKGDITFYHADQPPETPPGLIAADQIGAVPTLKGYVSRGSWPLYTAKGTMFVALMRPTAAGLNQVTAIAVFPSKRGRTRALIIATINGDYSSIVVVPNIHGPGCSLALTGRGDDGSLKTVSLWMDGQTQDEIADPVATAVSRPDHPR